MKRGQKLRRATVLHEAGSVSTGVTDPDPWDMRPDFSVLDWEQWVWHDYPEFGRPVQVTNLVVGNDPDFVYWRRRE